MVCHVCIVCPSVAQSCTYCRHVCVVLATGVYSRNRNFRILWSTKLGKSAHLRVAKENQYKVFIITGILCCSTAVTWNTVSLDKSYYEVSISVER